MALPTVLEMGLSSASGLLHAYWMGRVGSLALAAVSMGTSLRIVLISPMMGLSAGGMALVARRIGAGDRQGADHACTQALVLVAMLVLPLILIGQLFAPTFLGWMGASQAVWEDGLSYLRIVLWGLFFTECMPTMNGVIRGAGRPEYTLRVTLASRVVFFILEPILALGWGAVPALGVRGAAIAEVLASATGVAAQSLILLRPGGCLTLHVRDLIPRWDTMRSILKVALPSSAQQLSPNLANALFLRLVAAFGDAALGGYCLFTQLQMLALGINAGFQSAAATMVGQNLGAAKPERAARATWLAAGMAATVALAYYGLVNTTASGLLPWLSNDPAITETSRQVLHFALVFGVCNAIWLVFANALAGAGDTASAMLISVIVLWGVQLPCCWLLASLTGLGATGIWPGMIIGHATNAAAMALRFRSGRWQYTRL